MKFGLAFLLAVVVAAPAEAGEGQPWVSIARFNDASTWTAVPASGVEMKISNEVGDRDTVLRVDFDFHGGGGYAVLHRKLDLDLPENYRFVFATRGRTEPQNLEFKLIDDTGENVWWRNQVNHAFTVSWTPEVIRKRQISFAWGPKGGGELRHVAAIELAITAGSGGKGTVWIQGLTLDRLPVVGTPQPIVATASSFARGHEAAFAVDTLESTWWESLPGDREPMLTLDLGTSREFGGLVLDWRPGQHATDYDVEFDDGDGRWRTVRSVRGADGARDWLDLPESETRRVRLSMKAKPASSVALAGVRVMPLEWAATPQQFLMAIAKDSPRGHYPRAYLGEQVYWTVVGENGGREEALADEDGRVEAGRRKLSLEPFLLTERGLRTWADGRTEVSLDQGYLPIPTVKRTVDSLVLSVTAVTRPTRVADELIVWYRVHNLEPRPRNVTLFITLRPIPVNPPSQTLNSSGRLARIDLMWMLDGRSITINRDDHDQYVLTTLPGPDGFLTWHLDQGDLVERLAEPWPARAVPNRDDVNGRLSGILKWDVSIPAQDDRSVIVHLPIEPRDDRTLGLLPPDSVLASASIAAAERDWNRALGSFSLSAGGSGEVGPTVKAQLAYVLVNRDSAGIQPGSRSYERSWIRDGSLTSSALLHAGMAQPVKDFLLWYADHQYADGKVPCCVDQRGSDPVPENDSHGEFVYLAAEYLRLTGDSATAARVYPHVRAAVAYQDTLRAQRLTPEWKRPENAPYYGLLPPSISHEGYSAKPMHSYWDDLFALRGYKDGVWLAQQMGKKDDARWMAKSRDEFARDFSKAAVAAMKAHKIDYIPGCSDLGDFDATSTTIALNPVQEGAVLPENALVRTFERYWEFFVRRRDGIEKWDAFTPYEMRNIGAFVRLGWRERANELLDWFMQFRRPVGWRQWAEVVDHDYRHARFIGDMPHTWVGTDFVRSVQDMLAYEREPDSTLVLCAGISENWLTGDGVNVKGLQTRWGTVAYTLRRKGDVVRLTLDSSALRVPPGGIEIAPPLPPRGSGAWVGPAATQVGTGFVKLDADNRYRWRASARGQTPPPELEWTFKAPAANDPR